LTTLLTASMQHYMSSSSRQRLDRASIFSCFNRHAQCLNASQLKRAPQPANTILWTPVINYCDSYVTNNTICVVFGTPAQQPLRQLASQVYQGVIWPKSSDSSYAGSMLTSMTMPKMLRFSARSCNSLSVSLGTLPSPCPHTMSNILILHDKQ